MGGCEGPSACEDCGERLGHAVVRQMDGGAGPEHCEEVVWEK